MAEVMNLIPEKDYVAACDTIRRINKTATLLKSAELANAIEDVYNNGRNNGEEYIVNGSINNITSESDRVRSFCFFRCQMLGEANLPLAKIIEASAFAECTALKRTNFPSVTIIMTGAFEGCSYLKTISFPSALTMDRNVFSRCRNLTNITLSGDMLCSATADPAINPTCKIYVPASLIEQYKVAPNWSKYASQFVAIEGT